jgi:hypothetical protein
MAMRLAAIMAIAAAAWIATAAAGTGDFRLEVGSSRPDGSEDTALQRYVGENRFNESAAVFVSSQPRSPAGEYSGWQAGIRFARFSLDRSSSHPWTAALDVSDVRVEAPFYLVVWRCGGLRCGMRLTPDGPVTVTDIDRER